MDMLREQIEALKGEGLEDKAIAEVLGVEVGAVKSVTGGEASEREVAEMFGIVKELARSDDQPGVVRLRAATYVIDEHKGRNDKRAGVADIGNMTIAEMNRMLRAAQGAVFAGLEAPAQILDISSAPRVVDVSPAKS